MYRIEVDEITHLNSPDATCAVAWINLEVGADGVLRIGPFKVQRQGDGSRRVLTPLALGHRNSRSYAIEFPAKLLDEIRHIILTKYIASAPVGS